MRRLAALAVLLALLPALASSADRADYCATGPEVGMLGLVNAYRVSHSLPPLVASATLGAAAQHHSEGIAAGDPFSHTLYEDDGRRVTWQGNLYAHGYPTRDDRNLTPWVGEVLALGTPDPAAILGAWQRSPNHNAALLHTRARAIGIDRADGGPWRHVWTVTLGSVVDDPACVVVIARTEGAP